MFSNRFAFGALGAACIAAAAGGGYLATRQNAVPTPAAAASVESVPAVSGGAPDMTSADGAAPVRQTEAVVGDVTVPAATPAPAPPVASANGNTSGASREPRTDARGRSSRTAPARAPQVARQDTPALERSWPQGGSQDAAAAAAPTPPVDVPATERAEDRPSADAMETPQEPARTFDELVVSADSVIGLQLDTTLSSETARLEDRVEAHVTRAVRVNERIAIPAGTKAIGSVTLVEKGGKFKEQARLGVRFHTLVLDDGTQVPMGSDAIYRIGEAPNSAQKVGGAAVGGAILGAILGGGKGAVLGGLAGAGGGAAVTMAGDRNAASMSSGTALTVRINAPLTVTVDKES
jgi:hypothetical protein